MNGFVRNLLTEWRKLGLPFDSATVIAGISGGADSVSLALALSDLKKRKKLDLRIVLAHFNHNLRGAESFADAEFVEKLAEKLDLEFVGGLADGEFEISKKGNLEQNARRARYRFLHKTAQTLNAFAVLTAHTVNDQAETFLLNLLRGSGPAGLSGTRAWICDLGLMNSDFGFSGQSKIQNPKSQIALVRPLLRWAKRDGCERFCGAEGIEFRLDAMNEDRKFKRVRVRQQLLPLMQEFNPRIIETLARTAELLQIKNEKSPIAKHKSPIATVKELQTLDKSTLYTTLRTWLKTERGDLRGLGLKHFEALERLIASRKSGRLVELPNGETVVKTGGKLVWKSFTEKKG